MLLRTARPTAWILIGSAVTDNHHSLMDVQPFTMHLADLAKYSQLETKNLAANG